MRHFMLKYLSQDWEIRPQSKVCISKSALWHYTGLEIKIWSAGNKIFYQKHFIGRQQSSELYTTISFVFLIGQLNQDIKWNGMYKYKIKTPKSMYSMYTVELNFNKDQFYAFQDFESCWETFILIVSCQIPFTQYTIYVNFYSNQRRTFNCERHFLFSTKSILGLFSYPFL